MKKSLAFAPLSLAMIATFVLTSCESATPNYETSSQGVVTSVIETRVFVPADNNGCLFLAKPGQKPDFGPLAIFLPALISAGISTVSSGLKAAAGGDTAVLTGRANLSSVNGRLPECIEVVSGKFKVGNSGGDKEPDWYARYDGNKFASHWANFNAMLKSQNGSLAEAPDLVMEFAIVSAPASFVDMTVIPDAHGNKPPPPSQLPASLRLVPVMASYVRPPVEHRSMYRPHPISSITAALTVQWLGQSPAPSATTLNLDKIQSGKDVLFNFEQLRNCDKSVSAENGALQCRTPLTFVKESPWVKVEPGQNAGAIITATITEERTPSAFVQFFSDVLANTQSDLNKGIDASLPAGEIAATGTNLNNVSALAGKMAAAQRDLQACVVPPAGSDSSQLLAAVVADEMSANASAYAVRQKADDQPFKPVATSNGQCQAHLDAAKTYIASTLPKLAQ